MSKKNLFILLVVLLMGLPSVVCAREDTPTIEKGQLLPVPQIVRSNIATKLAKGPTSTVFEEDFETGGTSWSTSGSWAVGSPTSGPYNGHNSTDCAATNLSGDYPNYADDWLISPSISLPALTHPSSRLTLNFWEWFEIESGYDHGKVKVSTDGGTTWTELDDRSGSSDWRETLIDLSSYAGQTIKLGFYFTSDYSVRYAGWYVDDVEILLEEPQPLRATLVSLNHQNFPFIYMNVAVDTFGVGFPDLTQSNFKVYENSMLSTDYFEVVPPDTGGGVRLTDIIFLMDNSGSMSEEQSAVRNNVFDFVNNLAASGIDFALGLCRFGASENSGYPIVEDNGILTSNVEYFKNDVWNRNVIDGGFEPGWDALYESATAFSFRPGAQKIFILITDETPTGNDNVGNYSQNEAISILQTNSITTFALIELSDAHAISDYGSIAEQTNGKYFDIYSPFDEILDYISSQVANTYLVKYKSPNPIFDGILRNVEVIVSYGANADTCRGSYVPGSTPIIQRTQATIDLHNRAWAAGTEFTIEAEIIDNVAPYVQSATLYYRTTGTTSYSSTIMSLYSGNTYQGTIPGSSVQTPGVDYYITATDGQSTASDPSVDPTNNPYQIAILPNVAPEITHTPITASTSGMTIEIVAQIVDNTNSLATAELYYRKTGQLIYQEMDMNNTGGNNYAARIPSNYVTAEGVDYYIFAEDDFGVGSYHGTRDEPHRIYVGFEADIFASWQGACVGDAIIYINRGFGFEEVGRTGIGGVPVHVSGLSIGAKLRADKKIHTRSAVKDGHEAVDNTMFELWVDSDVMNYDGSYRSFEITSESDSYTLKMEHPIYKYNLIVSIEWDEVTDDYFTKLEEGFESASKYLYNVSDGQVMLNKIAIYDGKNHWDNCDIQIKPVQWPRAKVDGIEDGGFLFFPGGKIYLGRQWDGAWPDEDTYFRTIIHEFGHYGFALYDEYLNGLGQEDQWKRYREKHPDECPSNYGLMDYQYTATEASSHNDYLESYPWISFKWTVTEQLDERKMPCWDWIKQKLEGYYSNVNITLPPYGYYPDGYIYDRLGPDDNRIKDETEVLDLRSVAPKLIASNYQIDAFNSPIRITYNNRPVPATHVYVADENERMFLGKTTVDGYVDWPGAYTGAKIVLYKITDGRMVKKAVDITDIKGEYVIELDQSIQAKLAKSLQGDDPGIVLDANVSYSGNVISLNLLLLSDVSLSQNPQVTIHYGETSETISFSQVGSTNQYVGSVDIDGAATGFDGTGYLDISIVDMYSNQSSFTSYFKLFPLLTTELNRIFLRGFNMNVEEENISRRQLGISFATLSVPYTSTSQILYPVTEMFTVKFENDHSFTEDAGMNISYLSSEVEGLDERSLGIYRWNSSAKEWDLLTDSQVDVEDNVVSALVNSTGIYTIFATAQSSDNTPPGKINDLGAATGQGHAEISLTWTAPGDDGYSGQATNYIIRFNQLPIDLTNWDTSQDISNEPIPLEAGSSENMTITMPASNYLYYFAIRTEDENGNLSNLSNVAIAVSGTQAYTFSLLVPSFNDTTETLTPNFQWEKLWEDTSVVYTLWYGEDNLFESKSEVNGISENEFQLENALKGGTTYYWRVFAVTNSGDTVWCNQSYFRFTTELATPSTGNRLSNENVYIYPNPFNPNIEVGTIRFSLSKPGNVTIKIYDVSTTLVTTVISNVPMEANTELAVEWDGRNDQGDIVANGVYFYRITNSAGEEATGKVAVLR